MILYGNSQELLGANSTELEVLYGSEDMGRSFLRRQASRVKRVVKKTPLAITARVVKRNAPMAARVATKVAKKTPLAITARVVKRNAPMAARVTSRVVRNAAPIARQVLKNPLVRNAAASLVPGGPQALSLYSRLTAAKKEIVPKFTTTAPAPARPQPQPGRPPRKPRQRTWKPGLPNARTSAPAASPAAPSATTAQAPAASEDSFFSKHKTPLLVGGVAGIGLLALLAMKKKQG